MGIVYKEALAVGQLYQKGLARMADKAVETLFGFQVI
jgi:hypothetical protein